METVTQAFEKLWDLTGGVLFDPGHFLSLVPLLVAFGIALIVVMVRLSRKSKGRFPSPRHVLAMLFPKLGFPA